MTEPHIKKAQVWSSRLRSTHAVIALATLLLIFTGWLQGLESTIAETARGYHFLSGYLLVAAVGYRIYLFVVGKQAENFQALTMIKGYKETLKAHLRFYLSLGKSDLEPWFAQNPFWAPIYAVFYGVILLMIISGFLIGNVYFGPAISLTGIHAVGSGFIVLFLIFHLFAILLHDAKLGNHDISAIINGYKYFLPKPTQTQGDVGVQPIVFKPMKKDNKKS